MCVIGVETHSYLGLKDKIQCIPEYEEPTSLMMMWRVIEEESGA